MLIKNASHCTGNIYKVLMHFSTLIVWVVDSRLTTQCRTQFRFLCITNPCPYILFKVSFVELGKV